MHLEWFGLEVGSEKRVTDWLYSNEDLLCVSTNLTDLLREAKASLSKNVFGKYRATWLLTQGLS